MNRNEMLNKLKTIDYSVIWPDGSWKDIGFTEREIWVNRNGYGYFLCDEPNNECYKLKKICDKEWKIIKIKLEENRLNKEDLSNTSFAKTFFYEEWDCYDNQIRDGLNQLPLKMGDYFYCGETLIDGVLFFDNENDFKNCFIRQECDIKWEELDDESLKIWISRLFHNNKQIEVPFFKTVE